MCKVLGVQLACALLHANLSGSLAKLRERFA